MNESNDMTSKQDKQAFEKWFKEKRDELERNECATYVDSDEWCMSYGWQAACEYKDAQYLPRYEESEDAIYINGRKFYGEKVVKEYEADWLKMRDIAEETQRKLDQAIEVIRFYGKSEHWKLNRNNHAPLFSKCEDDLGEKARDFLAKIEGKKD